MKGKYQKSLCYRRPLCCRFLPSADVEAAAAAAAVSQLLGRSWRQGAETARALFSYLEHPEPCCRRLTPVTAGSRGPPVCEDPSLAPAADSCLVYSFGISADQSFELGMSARGCEVHVFDPRWAGAEGRQQSGLVLHRRALSGEHVTSEHRATLGQTLQELGHAGRPVDYLRVDVVGGEWDWLDAEDDSVLRRVRQLSMVMYFNDLAGIEETSQRNRNYMLKWYFETFGVLHELGFCLVSSRENVDYPRRKRIPGLTDDKATIWELMWVRR